MIYNGPPRYAHTEYGARFLVPTGTEVTWGTMHSTKTRKGTELRQVQVSNSSKTGRFWTETKYLDNVETTPLISEVR